MTDTREQYLIELYNGINKIANKEYLVKEKGFREILFNEFKTRMQHKSLDDLRKELAVLRSVLKLAE